MAVDWSSGLRSTSLRRQRTAGKAGGGDRGPEAGQRWQRRQLSLGRPRGQSWGLADPSKAVECPDPRLAWSVEAPGKPSIGTSGPLSTGPTELGAARPLTLTPARLRPLPPGPPGNPGPASPGVCFWRQRAGPSIFVIAGAPLGLCPSVNLSSEPPTHCPRRGPTSVSAPCASLWMPLRDPFPGAELGSTLSFILSASPATIPSLGTWLQLLKALAKTLRIFFWHVFIGSAWSR